MQFQPSLQQFHLPLLSTARFDIKLSLLHQRFSGHHDRQTLSGSLHSNCIARWKIVFLHKRILLQEKHTLRIVTASSEIINRKDTGIVILQIYVAPFFAGEHIPIVGNRHIGLSPLFAEGIVVLAVEVFAACRRHLRHDTCTAQMIRQEIMHFGADVRADDPSSAGRRALE